MVYKKGKNPIVIKKRGCLKLNYDKIAELIHDLVKNPKSLSSEQRLPSTELNTHELSIIQNVFSKYEVSGDTLTIGINPLVGWG